MTQSPFPGMDPYLEASDIWPDVHSRLMNIFAEQLGLALAPDYLAELETQLVISRIDDEDKSLAARPDVSVTRLNEPALAYTAAAAPLAAVAQPLRLRLPLEVPTRLISIFIRHHQSRKLVTVIELLSPVNKRHGRARREYLQKRRSYLNSPVHLVEIDLLRAYPRMPFDSPLPHVDYLVLVSRAGDRPDCDVWPITVRQPLPTIPIPLLRPDPDQPLEMGQALHTAYQRARYDLRVDYRQPATPPLAADDAEWARTLIEAEQTRGVSGG